MAAPLLIYHQVLDIVRYLFERNWISIVCHFLIIWDLFSVVLIALYLS